jgi:hypothetical protein
MGCVQESSDQSIVNLTKHASTIESHQLTGTQH